MTSVPPTTVADALVLLQTEYADLLADMGGADRVLWVGSGVSRLQVPPVDELLRKVLQHLKDHMDPGDGTDPCLMTLDHIVKTYLPDEVTGFRADPDCWVVPANLTGLIPRYSEILGEDDLLTDGYLLWDALNLCESYGSSALIPGPEHELLALLIHEGLVTSIVTTNWDALIEGATGDACEPGADSPLAVMMSNESFRTERGRTILYKAHGCAKAASEDEEAKQFIIARTSDIAKWPSMDIYKSMVETLTSLAKTRRSIMLGLSVQDYNLLQMLAGASVKQPWPWNGNNPAYVFAEPDVGAAQRNVLKVAYGENYSAASSEICERSASGMYSGLLLSAATLHLVIDKVRTGIEYAAAFVGSAPVLDALKHGVTQIETHIAASADDDPRMVVAALRDGISVMVGRFFQPSIELSGTEYAPFYDAPVRPGADNKFKRLRLPELCVALALMGLGTERGLWSLCLGTGSGLDKGVVLLRSATTPDMTARLVVTQDGVAASALKGTDLWTAGSQDLVLVHASGERADSSPRGTGGGIGSRRTGKRSNREVWLSELVGAAGDADRLLEAFRTEVSL